MANPIYTCKHAETSTPDPPSLGMSTIPYTVSDRKKIFISTSIIPNKTWTNLLLEFTQYSNKSVKFKHSMNLIYTIEC